MAQGQVLLWAFFYKVRGLSGRALPLHHYRHWAHVSFTAVLGMDVPQHCVGSRRSWVSDVPVEVLNALCVIAGKTSERHAVLVSTNAVHNKKSTESHVLSM
jgi:hypothetical protein